MDKVPVKPSGDYARWSIPSLQQLSTTSVLPIHDIRRRFESQHKTLNTSVNAQPNEHREEEMAAANSESRKRERASMSIPKRGHALTARPKPQTAKSTISRRRPKNTPRVRPFGPGSQLGATKDIPITIDDEDADPNDHTETYERPNFFRSDFNVLSSKPSISGIYASIPNTPRNSPLDKSPSGSVRGARTTPPSLLTRSGRTREPSIYTE
jgi:hypothetical protein